MNGPIFDELALCLIEGPSQAGELTVDRLLTNSRQAGHAQEGSFLIVLLL